ncbi:hypothetical protein FBU30_007186 [Linnemannia zychae]|nr:hypothetical protein FBU30_007186 [Linnemannia zychae]
MVEKTVTSIIWPPARETHNITVAINGIITTLPASQSYNNTLFPTGSVNISTTTTKPPPTTVIGINPPPPYISGSPTSTANSSGDGSGKSTAWRNWGLVIMAAVILSIIGGLFLRRYRAGRTKKQEPGNFVSVGEDDNDENERGIGGGGGGGTSSGTGGSIGMVTLGQGQGQGQGTPSQINQASSLNNVRERRNSQPIPRALDLDGPRRS